MKKGVPVCTKAEALSYDVFYNPLWNLDSEYLKEGVRFHYWFQQQAGHLYHYFDEKVSLMVK